MKVADRPAITSHNIGGDSGKKVGPKQRPTVKQPTRAWDVPTAAAMGVGLSIVDGLPMGIATALAYLGINKIDLFGKIGLDKAVNKAFDTIDGFFNKGKTKKTDTTSKSSSEFIAGVLAAKLSAQNRNPFKESDFDKETADRIIKDDTHFFSRKRAEQEKFLKATLHKVDKSQAIAEGLMKKIKSGKCATKNGDLDQSKLTLEERKYLQTAINNQL